MGEGGRGVIRTKGHDVALKGREKQRVKVGGRDWRDTTGTHITAAHQAPETKDNIDLYHRQEFHHIEANSRSINMVTSDCKHLPSFIVDNLRDTE